MLTLSQIFFYLCSDLKGATKGWKFLAQTWKQLITNQSQGPEDVLGIKNMNDSSRRPMFSSQHSHMLGGSHFIYLLLPGIWHPVFILAGTGTTGTNVLKNSAYIFIKIILEKWNILYYSLPNIYARDIIWVSTMISKKVRVLCFGKVKQLSIIKKNVELNKKSLKYKRAKERFSISLP